MSNKPTPEVLALGEINFSGNIIPSNWFTHLRYDSGKPHLNAIIILSEIVYWYRPSEVRDETTGQILGYKKKFKADKLQRSYKSFGEKFGLTKKQARDALSFLESKGLISKELRTIEAQIGTLSNVLFIGIIPTKIKTITLQVTPMTYKSHPPTIEVIPSLPESQTYTKNTTKTTTDISPSAKNEIHNQSSGDFGDPAKGDQPIIEPEDNETIPPVEADPQVSVFDENGYIIPQVETVLETMYKIGVVKMEEYDSHPHLGNIMWYHWVDNGEPVERIPLGLAKEYGHEISGGPEVSSVPGNVSVFDYKGNITVKMYDLLYEMAKLRLVTTEIRAEYSECAHFFWVDSGEPVESIPLEMAKEHGYKPDLTTRYETSGPPENVLVDTQTPYEVDEQTQKDKEETLTDVFGPNPRQQATQPKTKPELSEADAAHLRTFGHLPADKPPEAFDTVQEIKNAGWEIWDPTVEQGIAYCLEAIRTKKPNFVIPNNVSVRKDWNKDINGHLQDYKPDDLGTLYRLAVDKLEKAGMSYTRPGSLTKTLPDVVNEPTATTIIDEDGGFYV